MRIVCPSCHATYDVPDRLLAGPARLVRCARCSNEWHPEPAEPPASRPLEPVPEQRTDPPLEAELDRVARLEPRIGRARIDLPDQDERLPPQDYESYPSRRGPIVAWVLSLMFIAGIAAAAIAWRGEVMAAWPPSQRLFSAVGLK